MKSRCADPENERYGKRGIRVCQQWIDSFEVFLADIGPRPTGQQGQRARYSIERKDNDKNYEPGNCYWATTKEQQSNRVDTRRLTARGETHCIREWSRLVGINHVTLRDRLNRGWDDERAIFTPPDARRQGSLKTATNRGFIIPGSILRNSL